jgi:hypothetical protein
MHYIEVHKKKRGDAVERLGEETEIDQVFTLDRKGFSIYRMQAAKPFESFPK